jgi:P27 family predicted phage terminase small subunit
MGKRGTKPMPASLKLARGTYRASEDKGELSTVPLTLYPQPPEFLNEHGKEVWAHLLPKLMSLRVVSETDLFQFGNMCYEYGCWRECVSIVEVEGRTFISDKGNNLPNPTVHIASAHFKSYNQIAAKFGLTPSDRVGLPNTVKEDVDPLNELLSAVNG